MSRLRADTAAVGRINISSLRGDIPFDSVYRCKRTVERVRYTSISLLSSSCFATMTISTEAKPQPLTKSQSISKGLDGATSTNGHNGIDSYTIPPNAWSSPGPAAFDFRSEYSLTSMPRSIHSLTNTSH